MASAFDLVTRGGALVEGVGEGGGRLEAELENISSTLQDRVFGLIEVGPLAWTLSTRRCGVGSCQACHVCPMT